MKDASFQKISEPAVLILINAAVVFLVESAGDSLSILGMKTVDVIEFLFTLLVISRIFLKYGITDPVLRRFLNGSLLALVVLATAPVVRIATGPIMRLSESTVLLNTVNFYIISFLVFIISVEGLLGSYAKRSAFTV